MGGSLSKIKLRGQEVIRDFQLIAEETDFFWLGFKVFPLWVGEDKIEYPNSPLNEFDFVLPTIADVFPVDLAVEPTGV